MARETEQLVLQLSADMRAFQKELLRAAGEADRAAQRIERRFAEQNKRIQRDFENFGNQMRGALAALGVGFVIRDVVELGDTWTRVGNRLAFAGVQAKDLLNTQHLVADIASRTRADFESTADLFARMYRSSEDLGASLSDVAAVTEIVSKALAGASQAERASAIRQLGQGLGSGRLQGDELRSILENSRPIAEAIAAEFETTVGNLRRLGQEGRLESRRVFEAILGAGEQIDEAFARTTFTVADSFTRLRTEAARFVGTNKETSTSVRGLAKLIDAVADNFELLADAVVITATVLGGAFAGVAVAQAVRALASLATSASAASKAFQFLGGTFGITLGILTAGLAILATQTDVFTSATDAAARAQDSLYSALQVIVSLGEDLDETAVSGEKATEQIEALGDAAAAAQRALDDASTSAADNAEQLSLSERAARGLAEAEKQRAIATLSAAIADQQSLIAAQQRERWLRRLALLTPSFTPEQRAQNIGRAATADSDTQGAINDAQESTRMLTDALNAVRALNAEAFRSGEATNGLRENSEATAGAQRRALHDLEQTAALNLARLRHQEALVRELEDAAQIEQRTQAYIKAGLADYRARAIAEGEVRDEREASNAEAMRSYEIQRLQDRMDLARISNNQALVDVLSDELEIRSRTRQLVDLLGISEEEALARAQEYIATLREAREIDRRYQLEQRDLENALQEARARGDEQAERAIQRRKDLEESIAELRRLGLSEEAATERAQRELAALESADLRGKFRTWFTDGIRASLDGDLDDYFQEWLTERASRGLENALDRVADVFFDMGGRILRDVMTNGEDGIVASISGLFSGGATSGLSQLGEAAIETANVMNSALGSAAADAASKLLLSGTASAASAAKEAVASSTKASAAAGEIASMLSLTKAAYSAASALASVAAGGGGGGGGLGNIGGVVSTIFRFFGGGFADGGFVNPGKWHVVGERGPEIFVPKTPGYIVPNGAALGGGSPIVQLVSSDRYYIQGASTAEVQQLRSMMEADQAARNDTTLAFVREGLRRRKLG